MVKCANGNPDCRSFKITGSGIGFKGGRYIAETQAVAAKRAGSALFQYVHTSHKHGRGLDEHYAKWKNKTSIKFILMETTRGSNPTKKTVAYQVNKTVLSTPKTIKRGDQTITVKYAYTVDKLTNQPQFVDVNIYSASPSISS